MPQNSPISVNNPYIAAALRAFVSPPLSYDAETGTWTFAKECAQALAKLTKLVENPADRGTHAK